MPCTTPPRTWPSTIIGLIMVPQSSATAKSMSSIMPVAGSTATTAPGVDAGLIGRGDAQQRLHALRQSLHPQVGDAGDLLDADGAAAGDDLAAGAARLGRVALQQMRPDLQDFFSQKARGMGHRAAGHDDAARGDRSHPEWR